MSQPESTSLGRISKLFGAQNLSQLITILSQVLLPPAFLHAYGVSLYGQWLALGAALTYLSTFNYGLQTYTNMQMTIYYNRGELQAAKEVQSAGLRVLIATFVIFSVALLVIFVIPLKTLLDLSIAEDDAKLTLYILGCQIVAGMVFGFFSGSYMAIGLTHRGVNFDNAMKVVVLMLQLGLVIYQMPFYGIAGAQLAGTLLGAAVLVLDFSRLAPDLSPSLRYWKPGSLGEILRPSAQYALLYSSNVLAYQLPTLLMQRLLGPSWVVIFSLTRTIYSMSRRALYLLTNSIGPEITLAYGKRDWSRLHQLYEFSERIILLMTVPITFGTMLATPLILSLWVHRADLYDPGVCLILGITVSVLGIKEHKYQFQFSSNQIHAVSYMSILAYGAQLLLAGPVMVRFGLHGYLILWCVNESCQLFYMFILNSRLFGEQAAVDGTPILLLCGLLIVGTALIAWPMYNMARIPPIWQGIIAATAVLTTLPLSYRIFQVEEVRVFLWRRISGGFLSRGR